MTEPITATPWHDAFVMAGALPGWTRPQVVTELREAFGTSLMMENDVDAAALAERARGHRQDVDSFAFISVGTGVGMGLVLGGRLHRGAHGAAGEIGYLPLDRGEGADAKDARKRGSLEAAASAAGVVRAARRAGFRGPISARQVFAAARAGDERAAKIVADDAGIDRAWDLVTAPLFRQRSSSRACRRHCPRPTPACGGYQRLNGVCGTSRNLHRNHRQKRRARSRL